MTRELFLQTKTSLNSRTKIVLLFAISLCMIYPLEIFAEDITILIPLGDHEQSQRLPLEQYSQVVHTIEQGDRIVWINADAVEHTITSGKGVISLSLPNDEEQAGIPDGNFTSGILLPDKSWSFTFKEEGTFDYFCTLHPWIERSIVVLEPGVDVFGNRVIYMDLILILALFVSIFLLVAGFWIWDHRKKS